MKATLVLHDGKEPSVLLAVLMLLGGLVCAVISVLLLLSMPATRKRGGFVQR